MFKELETDGAGVLLPFSTAKHKYNVIRPGEAMGISRWTEYQKLSVVLGVGKTLAAIIEAFKEIEVLAAEDKPFPEVRRDLILLANSNRRAIVEMSKARYGYALYQATLFIVREGDEEKDWTMDLANDYIADFKEAGISEQSLFFFANKTVVGLSKQVKELRAEVEQQTGVLLASTGSATTEASS